MINFLITINQWNLGIGGNIYTGTEHFTTVSMLCMREPHGTCPVLPMIQSWVVRLMQRNVHQGIWAGSMSAQGHSSWNIIGKKIEVIQFGRKIEMQSTF